MSELQRRLVAYADSLKSRADISPEKFGTAIGVSLVPDEKVSIRSIAKDLVMAEGFNYAASYFLLSLRVTTPGIPSSSTSLASLQ
ncbi:hypothetical protein [Stenotrophomonas lactitubi]|uniref:hypothetical protein n=1 Tax=Stenotrophomonas lactitubi TaxID=2045214 RepID=UPI003209720B